MKYYRVKLHTASLLACGIALASCSQLSPVKRPGVRSTARSVGTAAPPSETRVFFEETHLHTANSSDAVLTGTRLMPEDALRFGSGETVVSNSGIKAKLARPLDFMVVADHAEQIGTGREVLAGNPLLTADLKDAAGANLDRIQIIKGWVDSSGQMHERIFHVAWSSPETRKVDQDGRLSAVGDTVDLKSATCSNSIGAIELRTVWRDPEFKPSVRAFYYARVLEIPTPRWPAYDALRYQFSLPDGVEAKSQERAYTSPIWYSPKAAL